MQSPAAIDTQISAKCYVSSYWKNGKPLLHYHLLKMICVSLVESYMHQECSLKGYSVHVVLNFVIHEKKMILSQNLNYILIFSEHLDLDFMN